MNQRVPGWVDLGQGSPTKKWEIVHGRDVMSPSNSDHGSGKIVERVPSSARVAVGVSGCLPEFVLTGWMERLGIDRDQVVNAPLLFHRLQSRCLRCSRMEDCARALAEEFGDAGWDSWYEYCSNSEALSTLGAIQNCSRAAAHLKLQKLISAG
jgi:hypothetical protein